VIRRKQCEHLGHRKAALLLLREGQGAGRENRASGVTFASIFTPLA
jgi:hypothetical protein